MYRSQTLVKSSEGAAAKAALPFLLLATAFLLSACAQPGRPAAMTAAEKNPKNPAHGVLAPATASTAKTAPAVMWQSADKLMGLAPDALQAALGSPARIRDEETGRIYQYVGSDCVLDLFLYQEATGAYRVSYAEARSIDAEKKPVDLCLKSLPAPIVADNAPSS